MTDDDLRHQLRLANLRVDDLRILLQWRLDRIRELVEIAARTADERDSANAERDALIQTKTFRYTRATRGLYRRLVARRSGDQK